MLQDITGVMQTLAKVRLFSNLIKCLVTFFRFWVITFFSVIKGVSGMLTPVTLKIIFTFFVRRGRGNQTQNMVKTDPKRRLLIFLYFEVTLKLLHDQHIVFLNNLAGWQDLYIETTVNPLHPDIIMHILFTVVLTFPKVLTRRICRTI